MTHQASLKTDVRVSHIALDFRTWCQSRHRVDYHNINCVAAHERIDNFKGLLTSVRLGNKQIIGINPTLGSIGGIKCMLCIYEGSITTSSLSTGNHVQTEGRLTGRFWTINLGNTSTWYTPNPQGNI